MAEVMEKVTELSEKLRENPELVDEIFTSSFDFAALIDNANELGMDVSEEEIEEYISKKFPSDCPELESRVFVEDETGEMRELSAEEIQSVGGGFVAAIVAAVAVLVVAVISVGVGVVLAVGVGVFIVAAVVTAVVVAGGGGRIFIP